MARPVRSLSEWQQLSDAERDERSAALSAVALARREGRPLAEAATVRGSSVDAIYEWAPEAVQRGFLGIPVVTSSDSIWRLRLLYVDGELDFVEAHGSDEAELAERIFELQWEWIHGDADAGRELQQYRDTTIDGRLVETDLDALRQIAARGDDPIDISNDLLPG
jgi:hypothetical protein